MPQSSNLHTTHDDRAATIAVMAYCPVDELGALQPQYVQTHIHHVTLPPGRDWRIVPVIISPMATHYWGDLDEAGDRVVVNSSDCVGAMLGGQMDEWTEEAPR